MTRRNKKDFSIKPEHTAIDTETINGKVVIMCSPKRSLYKPKTFEEIALFLLNVSDEEAHHIWTFNLTYDATAILKFIPIQYLKDLYFGVSEIEKAQKEEIKELTTEEKELYDRQIKLEKENSKNSVEYDDYTITFIPSKFFSITKNSNKCTLVDAQQFFNTSLDNASETFLDQRKDNNEIIEYFKNQEGKTQDELNKYLDENKDILIKYCQKDAYLTAKLGEKIDQSCYETYGLRLETYTSNAKIGEKVTLAYLKREFEKRDLPTSQYNRETGMIEQLSVFPKNFEGKIIKNKKTGELEVSNAIVLFASESFRGGLFEIAQRGVFAAVTDVDINSAYPSNMVNLPHWANGDFIELDADMLTRMENDILKFEYGWVACKFDCPYIPYNSKMSEQFNLIFEGKKVEAITTAFKIYYPIGERSQIITLAEYYFMKKYGYTCELICGFIWKQYQDKYPNPFGWIKEIYNKKTEIKRKLTAEGKDTKKDMNYLMCKIGMNGSYGKTVQTMGEVRPMFNQYYGSYITALTRIQVASFIIDNKLEDKVLNLATDGILFDGIYNFSSSEELGEMEINFYDSALLLGNGMQQLNKIGKDGKVKVSSRLRGVSSDHKFDIWTELKTRGELSSYDKIKRRPLHLGEALMHYKIFKEEDDLINTFISFGRKLDVNADTKRKWKQFKNFGELLNTQIKGERWTVKEIDEIAKKTKEKEEKELSDIDKAIKEIDDRLNRS